MNSIQLQNNNQNYLFNLESSIQYDTNDQQTQPYLTDEQKKIQELEAKVLYLKTQLEQKRKRESGSPQFERKVSKIVNNNNNQNNEFQRIVNIKIKDQELSLPLEILKMIPIYSTLEKYSDVENLVIPNEEQLNPEVVSVLFQFSTVGFYSRKLTDIISLEENFKQFYRLAERLHLEVSKVEEYLKVFVKLSILKDPTGKLILKYLSLINDPDLSWLYELIKSSMIQFSLEKKSANEILTIYKNFFSYIAKNKELSRKEEEILAHFLFALFPLEKSSQEFLSFDFIQDFCSAWIALHQFTCPDFLDETRRTIFLKFLTRPNQTTEMSVVRCLFDDKQTIEQALDNLCNLTKELKSYHLFYLSCLQLTKISQKRGINFDDLINFMENLETNNYLLISSNLKKLIQMDPLYTSSIFEILQDPTSPKISFSLCREDRPFPCVFTPSKNIVELFSEILEFIPEDFQILNRVGAAYKGINKFLEAINFYEKALVIEHPVDTILDYVYCIDQLKWSENLKKVLEKALFILNLAIQDCPQNRNSNYAAKLYFYRAKWLFILDRFQEALDEINQAFIVMSDYSKIEPNYITLRKNIMKQLSKPG